MSITLFAWACLAYKPYFSANEQYFSLTQNQPAVLLVMVYQPNKPKRIERISQLDMHQDVYIYMAYASLYILYTYLSMLCK